MSHCISLPSPPISIARGVARVHMVPAANDNVSWLLEHTPKQVALVDGPSLKPVIEYCRTHELVLTHILNTHTHGDHIGVNYGLPRAQKAEPSLCADVIEVWGSELTQDAIPHITRSLFDGERINLGRLQGIVWLTEGHLDGHISMVFWSADDPQDEPYQGSEAGLFCGDTLFAAGCGRLFDGPAKAMYDSLQKLCGLPPDTLVFPAHEYTLDNIKFAAYAMPEDPAIQERLKDVEKTRSEGRATLPSTIGAERATNPFVKATDVSKFADLRSLKDHGAHR